MSKPAHKNIEHPPGQIVYKILHDHVNPDGTEMTPLIAAMRCYVASKLGDEVDVPKELLERKNDTRT